ncbi:MAG: tryptophan 2,3-dioxygenase [Planctomycetes bacterium]|nr:tryptophan 2,3-dioxygenase [Planctomycetota bacterium]
MTERRGPTTYWDYIRVEELLALQAGIAPSEAELSDDEVRFIVIHQIDELWMKLVLREMVTARDVFRADFVSEPRLHAACAGLRRVAMLFEMMADHFRLMETMRTRAYLEFRDKLSPASGFQSAQLREIEILFGLDEAQRIPLGHEGSYLRALHGEGGSDSPALRRVTRRRADLPSLKDAVYRWLHRAPIQGSTPDRPDDAQVVRRWIEDFLAQQQKGQEQRVADVLQHQALTEADVGRLRARYAQELALSRAQLLGDDAPPAERAATSRLRAAILFIESHRDLPLLAWPAEVIDALIAAEQSMIVFRQRHARMVERVIGRRVGTGGSDGVDYLDRTALSYRVFKEIWAARTMLMRSDLDPQLVGAEYYGLRAE